MQGRVLVGSVLEQLTEHSWLGMGLFPGIEDLSVLLFT